MSNESKSTEDKILNLDKIISDLNKITANSGLIPEKIQITVHGLSDDYSNSVATLTEIFTEMSKRKTTDAAIMFRGIPITNTTEDYPAPVILINNEQELDAETQKIVRKRAENGFVTFPVILLSDRFFRLAYGESFSYHDIINTFEDSIHEKVMIFRKSEFRFLKEYLLFVSKLSLIFQLQEIIRELRDYLCEEAEKSESTLDTEASLSGLTAIARIKAIIQTDTELERIHSRLNNQIIEWNAEITNIREQCDRAVLEEITHIKADTISPFALNIDLKYGKLQEYIKDFLLFYELREDYDFINGDLRQLVSETEEAVNHNKAKLSLIGTFSSGKTTLINTFLGKRDIPLRTSMNHNTAVLTHLFYEPSANEYYDIIYKDKLTWTVVKPSITSRTIANKENDSIRILNVEKNKDGNYCIRYSLMKSKEQCEIRFRTSLGLAVKRGDVLKPNEAFTRTEKCISDKISVCSKSEIELIINLLLNSQKCRLFYFDDENSTNPKQAINLLKKIYNIASDLDSTFNYEDFCQKIGLNPSASGTAFMQNKSVYPEKYHRIVVECAINKKNVRKKLDHNGWLELCGDPNPQTAGKASVFSEKPECYMLAKELKLYVHTEFLQYCSLTDTPGFGSVTEEHDAVSERYIRDSSGRLLVMIAINSKTIDGKYQDLINSVDYIYNNFRKADKKNVIFILNCFTNLSVESNIRNQVEKVYQMLIRYGFNRNNIFVCNLRNALIEKQQTDTMFGYPSYKRFHDFIINEMISSDLTAKYRGIQSNWIRFFKDSWCRIDSQIFDLTENIRNIQLYKDKLNDIINKIRRIEIDKEHFESNAVQEDFRQIYDILSEAYLNNRKGIFENVRWNAILKALEEVQEILKNCNDDLIESIYDYYNNLIHSISYHGDSSISEPELHKPINSIVVLDIEHLKNMLSEADDVTHWYNRSKNNDYYTEKISEIIQNGFESTKEKAHSLCDEYSTQVETFKNCILIEKQSTLLTLENEHTIRQRIEKLKRTERNLLKLERKFKRITFV